MLGLLEPAVAGSGQESFPESPPRGKPLWMFSQSGQIGNRDGSRFGIQTLPHRALTGVPVTALSTILLFST